MSTKTFEKSQLFSHSPPPPVTKLSNFSLSLRWMLWRGSAPRFSRGEAVAKMGTSESIFVTDVECG